MAIQVEPPVRTPYRYGLLSTAQVVEHGESLRLQSDYVFDSVACHDGIIWNTDCANPFTVTFTRTETEDEFTVTVSPGVVGDYTYSVDGGAAAPLTGTVTIVSDEPVSVEVCEVGGLQRCVTVADVDPDSVEGTTYVFVSTQTNNLPKEVTEGIDAQTAQPFMVISGLSCTLIATPDIDRKARDAFASAEQRLVEQQFWAQLAAASPVVLGGGPVSIAQAVALLEAYLRDQTGFTGMLHSDAYVAPYASQAVLVTEENPETTKRTALWTPWVFGGGYALTGPAGQPAPAADQAWIYATGQVVIHRGDTRVYGAGADGFNVTTNQDFVIAERSYAVIPDCPVAAVLVQLEAAA